MNRGSSFFVPAGAQDFWVPTWAPRGRITPHGFANLENWWDADDASTITLDSGVSGWTDKKGSSDFGDPGATDRPVYATGVAALNGRSVIQFDGVNDNLVSSDTLDLTNAEETVFLVGKFPSTASTKYCVSSEAGAESFEFTLARDSTDMGEWFRGDTGDGDGAIRDWTWDTTSYHILVIRRKLNDGAAAIGVWEGGGASRKTTTHTVPSVVTSTLTLGMRSNDTAHYNCEIAELFRYSRKLPFAQIDSLCLNYLVPKWGAGAGEPSWTKMAA